MEEDKEVHSDREHNNQPLVWMLPNVKYPNNYFIRQHELDCADTFVAFFPYLDRWTSPYGEYRKEEYKGFIKYRIEPDRLMTMNGIDYCLEIDRGTEDIDDQLEPKIDKYIAYSNANKNHRFTVLITLQKYRRMNLEARHDNVVSMLATKKRGHQFLVTYQSDLTAQPLSSIWCSPLDPLTPLSLRDV